MGCGISHFAENFGEVFFTKNGEQVGTPQKMTRPVNGFYPLFGERHTHTHVYNYIYIYNIFVLRREKQIKN